MTDDLVKAAREALAGVTEGPWRVTECGDYWVEHKQPLAYTAGFRGVALCGDMAWPHAEDRQLEWEANARFIAVARSLVPAMADRIEALANAELAALDAIAEIEDQPKPVRYVWIVEGDNQQEVCNSKEEADYWQRQWQTWTPGSSPIITRFVEAPE